MRLPPDLDPAQAARAIRTHLEQNVPWGARLHIEVVEQTPGWRAKDAGPATERMRRAMLDTTGQEPTAIGLGGTIALLPAFEQLIPGVEVVMTAIEDAESRIHSANESVALSDLDAAGLTEAVFLTKIGKALGEGRTE